MVIKTTVLLAPLVCILTLMSGCSIYKMTGDTMVGYSAEHMIPYLLQHDDTDAVCATGLGLGGFLLSFERVTTPPHKAGVVTQLSASTCAERQVWSAELRYHSALKRGDAIEARDASIVQQRAHQTTAARLYRSYQHVVKAFGEPGDSCPELDGDWDEMVWLLGMLSAVQGLQHDRAVGGAVGMPMDLPAKAARGVKCLDNLRWWGVPQAIKGAVWASVPGTAPKGADPWRELKEAVKIGDAAGVRLARAIELKALSGSGKPSAVNEALTNFQESAEVFKRAPRWGALDQMARVQIRHMSDVIWMKAKGHRTPFGELGALPTRPDTASESDEDEAEGGGLFDDMDDEMGQAEE